MKRSSILDTEQSSKVDEETRSEMMLELHQCIEINSSGGSNHLEESPLSFCEREGFMEVDTSPRTPKSTNHTPTFALSPSASDNGPPETPNRGE